MNTQKIQTRGFTLVELIVVITILVILGTIAFINLGGQSASARDSKRTSDIRNLVSQVNIKQTGGVNFIDMVSSGATYQMSGAILSIAGSGNLAFGTDYQAGVPNYTLLGVSPDNFKDPLVKTQDYLMGATNLAGSAYQLAAMLEGDNAKTALVMGTYTARKANDYASGTTTNGTTAGTYTISLSTGIGLFKKDDWIKSTGTVAGTGKITAISSDLKTITVGTGVIGTSGTNFALVTAESVGLIRGTKNSDGSNAATTTNSGVVNGSGYILPY